MKKILLILTALFLTATAQAAKKDKFTKEDKNKDGFVSKEEYIAARSDIDPKKVARWFNNRDKDGNGRLSREEHSLNKNDLLSKKKTPKTGKTSSPKKPASSKPIQTITID